MIKKIGTVELLYKELQYVEFMYRNYGTEELLYLKILKIKKKTIVGGITVLRNYSTVE